MCGEKRGLLYDMDLFVAFFLLPGANLELYPVISKRTLFLMFSGIHAPIRKLLLVCCLHVVLKFYLGRSAW